MTYRPQRGLVWMLRERSLAWTVERARMVMKREATRRERVQ
jgi:hypothetical protein